MRIASDLTLPLEIDRADPRPLPRQVADSVRQAITDGLVRPGDPLPPSRSLARQGGVGRGTVIAGYDQLLAEGYLVASPGRATVVNPALASVHPHPPGDRRPGRSLGPSAGELIDLRPGRPLTAGVTTAAWRRAWREAAGEPPAAVAPAGLPDLRAELADHLRRMRGVIRDPEALLVTAGAREGFALLLAALGGGLTVGVEDPGYPSLRRVPERLGARVIPLPTDSSGLICEALPQGRAAPDVVVVTPSHQYPLGGSLPVARRYALLEWASAEGVWVVEDDYDAELRYTSAPLPALASLDDPVAGRVVTLGTFAKTLGPGLGAGFLVAPDHLLARLLDARRDLGSPVGRTTQRALAIYLHAGELRRHTQRVRREYLRRRQVVLEHLSGLDGVRVDPMDGGLQAVVEFRRPESEVVGLAREQGVLVAPLSDYWSAPRPDRAGVVLGFGDVTLPQLRTGLGVLARGCVSPSP